MVSKGDSKDDEMETNCQCSCLCMHGRNADNGMWKQIGFLFKEAYYPCGSFHSLRNTLSTRVWRHFKKYVEEKLGDRYEVQLYPNELLGGQTKANELTQTGAIDFTISGTPNLEIFCRCI